MKVKTGLATGNSTEIIGSDLKEGDVVVNGQSEAALAARRPSAKGDGSSPFMPKMPKRNRNSAKGR